MTVPAYAVVLTCRSEHDLTGHVYRAAVDSARIRLRTWERNIPVIVVDDCSPGEVWKAALAQYDQIDDVEVLRMGAPRAHSALVPGAPDPSFGHGPALDLGLWWAKQRLGCTRALVLDGDCFLVAEDAAARIEAALPRLDGETITVGDWVGTPVDWNVGPQTAGVYWHTTPHRRTAKAEAALPNSAPIRAYGYDPLICSLVDLDQFWHPSVGALLNTGWVANVWYYTQVARGKRSGYAPFFRGGMAAHLGHASVAASRGWHRPFGNVRAQRYAGKEFGTYHAGYLQIASVETLVKVLTQRRMTDPVEAALFVPADPPEGVAPQPYLRYQQPIDRLDAEHQALTLEYVQEGDLLARATVVLDGDLCRIENVKGPGLVECFAEVCEHAVAMLRVRVQAPRDLYERARAERNAHPIAADANGTDWVAWNTPIHYVRSSPTHHRWAEHFRWEAVQGRRAR